MKYNVVIRSIKDEETRREYATALGEWLQKPIEDIFNNLRNDMYLKRECTEGEAYYLKEKLEDMHVSVCLTRKIDGKEIIVCAEGEDEDIGRHLTDGELSQILQKRNDIFTVESARRVPIIQASMLVLAIAMGVFCSTLVLDLPVSIDRISPKVISKPKEGTTKVVVIEKPVENVKTDKKTIKSTKRKNKASEQRRGGGGDPRARVTNIGVLSLVNSKVTTTTMGSDMFAKGGFANDINTIIQGVGGLKTGGGNHMGRKGGSSIGYGNGSGPGIGGGSGGIGGLLGYGNSSTSIAIKRKPQVKVKLPTTLNSSALTGGRTRSSIMRVVRQNLAALRYAYNKELRETPGLKGKITVRFAIDEFGKVIFCSVQSSSMNNEKFENAIVTKIKRWRFDKIDKPGDVTEVNYPFVFSE